MKIRVLSDIHLEFGDYVVEPLPDDKDSVLVLAGDITVAVSRVTKNVFAPFIKRCSEQFKYVIMIMGNHEHYNGDILLSKGLIEKHMVGLNNVRLLQNETCYLDNVAFIGATMWTDCSLDGIDMSPKAEMLWNGMTDSKIVKHGGNKMTSHMSRDLFIESKEYVLENIKQCNAAGYETVAIMHHCPSSKSTHAMYAGQDFNMFFVSQMDLDLAEANPDLVIHGHTHHAFDYMLDEAICKTRVVCNPRGYHGRESDPIFRGFNPLKVVEV